MQDISAASAFIAALGAADQPLDWRMIHDKDKGAEGINIRGTLAECWSTICQWNNAGYGAFVIINAMDGVGRLLGNVHHIRAHFVDLDNLSAMQNAERARNWYPAPSFMVQSSPNKAHIYWPVQPYTGNDYFSLIQRKLIQFFDGDKPIIDATRVMRVPGTYHCKADPVLVTCSAMPGYGNFYPVQVLEAALANVNVIDGGHGERHELGDPTLAAPSIEWVDYALECVDPNTLDRGEWISFTSAIKQAGWTLATEAGLYDRWSAWCQKYDQNDPAENSKQWNSIRNTQVGWPSIVRRVPTINAQLQFGGVRREAPTEQPAPAPGAMPPSPPPVPGPTSGEFLTDAEQRLFFSGCVFVEKWGKMLTPSGRLMDATAFNGTYGGKIFIINRNAKVTNEPWQAATRSTLWTVPKADHIRFVPSFAPGALITDELGRIGVNMYRPAVIKSRQGDPTPFFRHLELILPIETDRKILLDYIAHNIKFPGHKIPWAPMIQSAEGVGKGFIKSLLRHCMAGPYVYFPNAAQMIDSGSKFNAWMRNKLMIIVDEIKVDERRDMIEILKPMISEKEIEVQGKGIDQDKEDNYSNWVFFSNWRNAIPINVNGRRFSIFYSAMQTLADLERAGMTDDYFNRLFNWQDFGGGNEIIMDWFLRYPIERGAIPMRSPVTSSTQEAFRQSRGPIEQLITDALEDGLPGFRGGWISTIAVMNRIKASGARSVSVATVTGILEAFGYYHAGRAPRPFFAESPTDRTMLYALSPGADVNQFGRWQGYE